MNGTNGQPQAEGGAKAVIRLSDKAEYRVQQIIKSYPRTKSAIMAALYLAQDELGWLTPEAYEWVAARIGVSPAHARAVATFYTMYYKKPVGKYHVQVCRTLSCMLCGARELTAHLKKRLNVAPNQVTADGMWSFEEVECLGSCGTAPMVEINDVFFENLTVEKLDALLDRIAAEQPNLRYSTVLEELGNGLADQPRSQAWKTVDSQ